MGTSDSSSIASGPARHLATTTAPPSRSGSPAAVGFPSASANLYHLHAALTAILPTSSSDGSEQGTSQPLPLSSLLHSRAFLLDLKRQADGAAGPSSSSSAPAAAAAGIGTSRSGLWQTEQERTASQAASLGVRPHRGEARALGDALDALPAHWKLHNAFCSRCVGIVIPGITASSLVGEGKGKQREVESIHVPHKTTPRSDSKQVIHKKKRLHSGSSDLNAPPLVCLLCQMKDPPATKSRKRRRELSHGQASPVALKSYASLTSDERLAKKASLGKFPSVRRRDAGKKKSLIKTKEVGSARPEKGAQRQERRPPPAEIPVKAEVDQVKDTSPIDPIVKKEVIEGTSKAGELLDMKKGSLHSAVAAPISTMALPTPAPRQKPPTQDTPRPALAAPSSLPDSKTTMPASKPPSKVTDAPAHDRGSSKKKDHKAALRAMLAKGGAAGQRGSKDKKKVEGSASGEGGGSAAGGGGGLRDFLAGL